MRGIPYSLSRFYLRLIREPSVSRAVNVRKHNFGGIKDKLIRGNLMIRNVSLTSVLLAAVLATGCASATKDQQDAANQRVDEAVSKADEAQAKVSAVEQRANEAYRLAEEALAAAKAAQQSADAANERAARMLQQSSRK